jgi:CRP/FNR family transcriptional regulator
MDLRKIALLQDVPASDAVELLAESRSEVYSAGESIFSQGGAAGDLLIIESGIVKIIRASKDGRQQLLSLERAGSTLGEVSLFDRGPYSATALALTETVLIRIAGDRFRALCASNPALALNVIRILGRRLRRLRELVDNLSFRTVRGRLILYFLDLAGSRVESQGSITVRLIETHEEIAARIGTVRELVSRNLGRLHSEGLIEMRKRSVHIPDLARLHQEV